MTTLSTLNDQRVRDAVLRQLQLDTGVDASGIAVTAADVTVTLTGIVGTYAEKLAAERAARRVRGVRAIASDIQVRLRVDRTDTDIAVDAARVLVLCDLPDGVQATVHGGHITLTGRVRRRSDRIDAERATRHIHGVKGVFNHIVVVPGPTTDPRAGIAMGTDIPLGGEAADDQPNLTWMDIESEEDEIY